MYRESFSLLGEVSNQQFSTENIRHIPANTPFGILGFTQVKPAAELLYHMSLGSNGLVDRFLTHVPDILVPQTDVQDLAHEYLNDPNLPISTLAPLYAAVQAHHSTQSQYAFSAEADQYFKDMRSSHVKFPLQLFTHDLN